jgi:hypothetical protein
MKTAAINALASLLSLYAQAQPIELTLSCRIASLYDSKTREESEPPKTFSLIVRLLNDNNRAVIEPNIGTCSFYRGFFTEREVSGTCELTDGTARVKIDRITGQFDLEQSGIEISAHCTPSKKLF